MARGTQNQAANDTTETHKQEAEIIDVKIVEAELTVENAHNDNFSEQTFAQLVKDTSIIIMNDKGKYTQKHNVLNEETKTRVLHNGKEVHAITRWRFSADGKRSRVFCGYTVDGDNQEAISLERKGLSLNFDVKADNLLDNFDQIARKEHTHISKLVASGKAEYGVTSDQIKKFGTDFLVAQRDVIALIEKGKVTRESVELDENYEQHLHNRKVESAARKTRVKNNLAWSQNWKAQYK